MDWADGMLDQSTLPGSIAEAQDAVVGAPQHYYPPPRMMAGGAGAYYKALGMKKPKSAYH